MSDLSWMQHALCTRYDPDQWFKTGLTSRVAKRICAKCPVLLECRVYSLTFIADQSHDQLYGVWGGLSRYDRRDKGMVHDWLQEAKEQLANR